MSHTKMSCFLVVGLLAIGCGSQSGSGASGSSTGAASGAAAAPAGKGGCPAGAYRDEKLKFCINVPAGFKAGPTEEKITGPVVRFEGGDHQVLVVRLEKAVDPAKAKEIMASMAKPNDPTDKKEAGSDGDMLWVITTYEHGVQQFDLYTPGVGGMLSCNFQARTENAPAMIAVCKSLTKI